MASEFREKLDYYCRRAGYRHYELAPFLHVTPSAFSKWVNGVAQFPNGELRRVCEILELDKDETEELVRLARERTVRLKIGKPVRSSNEVSTSDVPLPLQRPRRSPHFTGREAEIEQILEDLQPGQIVTLVGPGGVGKTAIAAEVVERLAPDNRPSERFPDGIIFHQFYNQPAIDLAFNHIINSYGETHVQASVRDIAQASARDVAQDLLAIRRALLILDSADNTEDLKALLDICGSCGVLITTRHRHKAAAEGRIVEIETLSPDDAREVLHSLSRGRVVDDITANKICELVGYLPLALYLASSYMSARKQTAAEYLEELKNEPLQALHLEAPPHRSIPILLAKSLTGLEERAKEILAVLGQLALKPFHQEEIAAALTESTREARRLLGELVDYSLIDRRAGNSYQVAHALIHTYARRELDGRRELLRRLAYYYIEFTRQQLDEAIKRGEYFHEHISADEVWGKTSEVFWIAYWSTQGGGGRLDLLDPLWPHLKSLLVWADRNQEDQLLIDILMLSIHYKDRRGLYDDRLEYAPKAIEAAKRLDQKVAEALFQIDALGHMLIEKGGDLNLKRAKQEIEDGRLLARSITTDVTLDLQALASAFLTRMYIQPREVQEPREKEQFLAKADEEIKDALTIRQKCRPIVQERILLAAGESAYEKRMYQAAIDYYEEARELMQQIYSPTVAKDFQFLHRLGSIYLALYDEGEYDLRDGQVYLNRADNYFREVLEQSGIKQQGNTIQIAYAELGLARVASRRGNREEALKFIESAVDRLKEFKRTGHKLQNELDRERLGLLQQ